MATKIGIPRAGLFYYYYPFCKYFFEGLGFRVIVSEKTNKEILNLGLKNSINDFCLPIKLYIGHALSLKDEVDYIFVPYIITYDKQTYLCPKIIALPDVLKNYDLNIMSADINVKEFYSSLLASFKEIALKLTVNPVKIYQIYKFALEKQIKFDNYIADGLLFDSALEKLEKEIIDKKKYPSTIALIGHTYVLNDEYINLNIVQKLNSYGYNVITSDKLTDKEVSDELRSFSTNPHWTLGKRIIASSLYFDKREDVKGIIYLTPFGCSPDSLIKDKILNIKKPILTITIDEQTGEAGLITRVEAFIDLLK